MKWDVESLNIMNCYSSYKCPIFRSQKSEKWKQQSCNWWNLIGHHFQTKAVFSHSSEFCWSNLSLKNASLSFLSLTHTHMCMLTLRNHRRKADYVSRITVWQSCTEVGATGQNCKDVQNSWGFPKFILKAVIATSPIAPMLGKLLLVFQ